MRFARQHLVLFFLLVALLPAGTSAIGVRNQQKLSALEGNLGIPLLQGDGLGAGVVGIGDLDEDGVPDMAVGVSEGNRDSGSVWILFLNPDGSVKARQQISDGVGGFTGVLARRDAFGSALANLGDLDGDGIPDLAVGAPNDLDGARDGNRGAVWILFLNRDGTVKAHQKISAITGGLDPGTVLGRLGFSIDSLGDLDGNGLPSIAVGTPIDDTGGNDRGAVLILELNPDGTVQGHQKIDQLQGGFVGPLTDGDRFGASVAALGAIPGLSDHTLLVGATGNNISEEKRGTTWLLGLNSDGSVASEQRIGPDSGGFTGNLVSRARFGTSISFLGDLNEDGVTDAVVGAPTDGFFGDPAGSIWLILLRPDGTTSSQLEITRGGVGGFKGALDLLDRFGASVTSIGDLDGDGIPELAVGAVGDDDGERDGGAVWILFLENDPPVCGDGALGPIPIEECDDGNLRSGDLCSSACEVESFLSLVGEAQGGEVRLAIDGVPLAIPTLVGDSADSVIDAIARAIETNPVLTAAGVTVQLQSGFLSTNGTLSNLVIADAGLAVRESALEVYGDSRGGSIELEVGGVSLVIPFDATEDLPTITRNIASAINLDPALAAIGFIAYADGNKLITNAEVTIGAISDSRLQIVSSLPGITTLALDGSPTPIGGRYEFDDEDANIRPSRALMDAAGNIHFRTRIQDGPVGDALFRTVGDRVEPFVLPGSPAPGTGGGTFGDFQYRPNGIQGLGAITALSPDGELAFFANLVGSAAPFGSFATDGSTTRPIAIGGTPAPGFGGALWLFPLPVAINDSGDVILFANLSDGRFGLFLVRGENVSAIALQGDPVPGTGGGTFELGFAPPGVALNNQGKVAISTVVNGGSVGEALLTGPPDALSLVLADGDEAPGFLDAQFQCVPGGGVRCSTVTFGELSFSDDGRVAFRGIVRTNDTGRFHSGIFAVDESVVTAIAITGDPAPGTDQDFRFLPSGLPAQSRVGDVGFTVDDPVGIYVADASGNIEARALGSTPAPRTGGQLFSEFRAPLGMDATGRRISSVASVSFRPTLPQESAFGLFRYTKNSPPMANAGPDQQLECSDPSGTLAVLDGGASSDADSDALDFTWSGPSINATGQNSSVNLAPGRSEITLTVTDPFDASDQDRLEIEVSDTQAPSVDASLTRLGNRWWWRWFRSFGFYRVRVSCDDLCDGAPEIRAKFGRRRVSDGDVVFSWRGRRSPALVVKCNDASGNSASAVAWPRPRFRRR